MAQHGLQGSPPQRLGVPQQLLHKQLEQHPPPTLQQAGKHEEGLHPAGKQLVEDAQHEVVAQFEHSKGMQLVFDVQHKPPTEQLQDKHVLQLAPLKAQENCPPTQHKKFPALQARFEIVQGRFINPQI
jgi:hypothetical protein